MTQLENGIGVINTRMREIDIRWAPGTGAGCDHKVAAAQGFLRIMLTRHLNLTRLLEVGAAEKDINPVAGVEIGPQHYLIGYHLFRTLKHLGKGKPARLADITEHGVSVELNDLLDRVSQCLGGNRALVSTVPAHGILLFDNGNTAALLGSIDRSAFASRTGANHNDIIVIHSHYFPLSRKRDRSQLLRPWLLTSIEILPATTN